MKTNLLCASIVALSTLGAGTAVAGGSEGTIGVGAETQLAGLSGISVNYDAGKFHAGGQLYFADAPRDNNTDIGLGGRFFWHLHSTPTSDFSIGGNLGVLFDHKPEGDPNGGRTQLFLEPAVQIRAFISGNVALSATAGIAIGLADADGVLLDGQITGGAGIHYYFY